MPDPLVLILVANAFIHALASGVASHALASRLRSNRGLAAALGALLPWIGLVAPLLMARGRGPGRPQPARRGLGLAGVGLLLVGAASIAASVTAPWGSVGGHVGSYATSAGGGLGDTAWGASSMEGLAGVLIALALASWARGGLRFAVPAVWIVSTAGVLLLDAVAAADLVGNATHEVSSLSGGRATMWVGIGLGAKFALVGCAVGYFASLLLVLQSRLSWSLPAPRTSHPHSSLAPTVPQDNWGTGATNQLGPQGWTPQGPAHDVPPPPTTDGW